MGGLSRLAVWWIKLGIVPERIEAGHPEQLPRKRKNKNSNKSKIKSKSKSNNKTFLIRKDCQVCARSKMSGMSPAVQRE